MKISISTDSGMVSAHFGRCPEFTLVTIEGGKVIDKKVIANPGHQPGFLPQFLAEQGVDTVVAGGMGPRAVSLFEQAGISPLLGVSGPVEEVIGELIRGTLQPGESTCSPGAGKNYGVNKSVCDHVDAAGEVHVHDRGAPKGRVCVSAQGETLESQVDPRFGRCAWFIIHDLDSGESEAIGNTSASSPSGAGISSAQQVVDKGVRAVITGNVGPNAFGVLSAAGVDVVTGAQGMTVREALAGFAAGKFNPVQGPSVNGHHGL